MYMNATRVVCRVKDFRRPEQIAAEVQLQNFGQIAHGGHT